MTGLERFIQEYGAMLNKPLKARANKLLKEEKAERDDFQTIAYMSGYHDGKCLRRNNETIKKQ